MKRFNQLTIGRRFVKTGLAVFLTSFICLYLGLPAHFAVIAAIVTIEPTASESIRKGIIRLPASAIGAALAVAFFALWGESALTYAAAAVLTIYICMKLKLHEGVLIATLTAVAMIPEMEGDLLLVFLSRLGTTSIGLIVSTLVNFFVLPPKFTPLIKKELEPNFKLVSAVLEESVSRIIHLEKQEKVEPSSGYMNLKKSIQKLNDFATYQDKEWNYHRTKLSKVKDHTKIKQTILILEKIVLHLGNLQYLNEPGLYTEEEKNLLNKLCSSFHQVLTDPSQAIPQDHNILIHQLDKLLKYEGKQLHISDKYFHHFTTKTVLFYELLSLHDSLEELEELQKSGEEIRG